MNLRCFVLFACCWPAAYIGAQEATDRQPPAEPPLVLPQRTIAIVRDGDSAHFDELIAGFAAELGSLAAGQYEFVVRDDWNAGGDLAVIPALIEQVVIDPGVDVVFTAGIVSTSHAARMDPALRTKAIVGGAIEFADLDDSLLGGQGASALSNYTFVRSPRRIPADLERLAQLAQTTHVHALVEARVIEFFGSQLDSRVQRLEQRLGLKITMVAAGKTAEESVRRIPEDARAVYVSLLTSATTDSRRALFAAIAARGLPSLSIRGVVDVDLGALAGLAPANDSAVHRRMALNLHQILSGIPTELLPVTLRAEDRLVVNMRTARQIGWSPDYDTSLAATFVEQDAVRRGEQLTLEQALEMAAVQSTNVRSARARSEADASQLDVLRALLRPQVSVGGQGAYRRVHDRINRLTTPRHSEELALGAEISQLLYSHRVGSQVAAQREIAESTAEQLAAVRLDAMETVGVAFLDALSVEGLYRIEKENLLLTENNLQVAKLRREIGEAEPSEVFRWESSQAQARAQLILRDRDRLNARVQLNVALGVPRTKAWDLADIQLSDTEFYFLDEHLAAAVTNQQQFDDFLEFVKQEAAMNSPEVRSFERSVTAQGILLDERRTRNFLPEVSVNAGYDYVLQDGESLSSDDQNEWSVGIGFSIPLFAGGTRRAEMRRLRATIRDLSAQRDAALYLIEQRALAAGYGISASHPGMRLSRRAQRAAEESFAAVQSKYSQGAATVVDLLDAQRELLARRQSAGIAGYEYLQDVVSLQRAMAWFEYSKTEGEKLQWVARLSSFLQRAAARREENR
ncbi:MAG: TolC family protein [Planctomycetota bacterium]